PARRTVWSVDPVFPKFVVNLASVQAMVDVELRYPWPEPGAEPPWVIHVDDEVPIAEECQKHGDVGDTRNLTDGGRVVFLTRQELSADTEGTVRVRVEQRRKRDEMSCSHRIVADQQHRSGLAAAPQNASDLVLQGHEQPDRPDRERHDRVYE